MQTSLQGSQPTCSPSSPLVPAVPGMPIPATPCKESTESSGMLIPEHPSFPDFCSRVFLSKTRGEKFPLEMFGSEQSKFQECWDIPKCIPTGLPCYSCHFPSRLRDSGNIQPFLPVVQAVQELHGAPQGLANQVFPGKKRNIIKYLLFSPNWQGLFLILQRNIYPDLPI